MIPNKITGFLQIMMVRHAFFFFISAQIKNLVCPRIGIWEFLTVDWEKKVLLAIGNGAHIRAPNIGIQEPWVILKMGRNADSCFCSFQIFVVCAQSMMVSDERM